MSVTIRKAQRNDARACASIIRQWGAETPWMPPLDDLEPTAAAWADDLSRDTAWVAEMGGDVVGFCVRDGDTIVGLYIATSARSMGIGAQLVARAKAGQPRLQAWCYEPNQRARRFYRREGFSEVGKEPDEEDTTGTLIYVRHVWVRPDQPMPDLTQTEH